MTEIQIKGLKISRELCLIRLYFSTQDIHRLPAFCGLMARSRINLPFISTAHQANGFQAACCADARHQPLIRQLVDADSTLSGQVSYIPHVGSLTLYPHQSSLKLFGMSLRVLTRENFQVLEMASSIGALTYVLDYAQLDAAAELLGACFNLVGNHSPFRSETVVCPATQRKPGTAE